MTAINTIDLLNTAEAADLLGVEEATLRNWRVTKRYALPYVKMGRLVKYRRYDLEKFVASRTVEPVEV